MLHFFKLPCPAKLAAQQLQQARLELVHYEHMLDQVQAAVAQRRAIIKRLEKQNANNK